MCVWAEKLLLWGKFKSDRHRFLTINFVNNSLDGSSSNKFTKWGIFYGLFWRFLEF